MIVSAVPQASCRDCELEEASSAKDVLETFCRSDFGKQSYTLFLYYITILQRLVQMMYSNVSLSSLLTISRSNIEMYPTYPS